MNETTALQNLHYFFSTAPQVLGAILAITGAVVIIKIGNIKSILNSISQNMIDFGKPKSKEEKQEYFENKTVEDAVEENFNLLIDEEYFGKNYNQLKYAQIGGDINKISSIIKETILPKAESALKAIPDGVKNKNKIEEIESLCNEYLQAKNSYDIFIRNTKTLFIINGLILCTLICNFLFLPKISNIRELIFCNYVITITTGYWIVLWVGMGLTILSIFLIIKYLISIFD